MATERPEHGFPNPSGRVRRRKPEHRRSDLRHRIRRLDRSRGYQSFLTALGRPDRDYRPGRTLLGGGTLDGPNQTLPDLYALNAGGTNHAPPGNNTGGNSYYHDITVGSNGFSAGPGYDLATGIGSPLANNLLPQLAAVGIPPSQIGMAIEPPDSIVQDGVFGTVAAVEFANGTTDPSFSGSATLSLLERPGGASFTPVTVTTTDGLSRVRRAHPHAVVQRYGLRLPDHDHAPERGAVSTTTTRSTWRPRRLPAWATITRCPWTAACAATSGRPTPMAMPPTISSGSTRPSIRSITARSLSRTHRACPARRSTWSGIFNQPVLPSMELVAGQKIGVGDDAPSRLFEVIGNSSFNLNVNNIDFYGGQAVDDGGLSIAGISAAGGAFLIDGGNVKFSGAGVFSASAIGPAGSHGSNGAPNGNRGSTGGPGGNGGNGGNAAGGGIFLDAGNLTLINSDLWSDRAFGGAGGVGGHGGNGATVTEPGLLLRLSLLRQRRQRRQWRPRRLGPGWRPLCRGRHCDDRQRCDFRQRSRRRSRRKRRLRGPGRHSR